MAALSTLGLPERRRNYRFALTPLADAMFQLLIFFMLSSGLTPYSLLTLQSAPAEETAEASTGQALEATSFAPDDPATEGRIWTIEAEAVVVKGQRFGFDTLDTLVDDLAQSAEAQVLLIVRPSARVQDITTVLSRLSVRDISVQVTKGAI